MNITAATPSHTHTHRAYGHDATAYARSDPYAAEHISAQEAMKGMTISEPRQHNHGRKSGEVDEAYGASRVERHLANRARSKMGYIQPTVERRHSAVETASNPAPRVVTESNGNRINTNDHGPQSHQPQNYSQDPVAQHPDQASYPAPTQQQFRNQKVPISPSPTSENGSARLHPAPGRQSRPSSANSQGNFGKVLLAENDITGEQVAVKILEKVQFKSERQRLHATREARLMATLRHPNIVDVKAVMEDDYRILIVMENLTGGELFDYISNKGHLEEKEARHIFQQIVLAIHYCHEDNIVHRDLKPENILLDSEKNVRVVDFGFGSNWHKDRHLTTYCGSPFYAAPEMVSGTPYIGPETDVWSLGVILYVLVCGRLPFDACDLPALFAQIKRGNYQKPREGSIHVCSLIHRMLTVDPKHRATLTDVLRSRWMRSDGMEPMVSALPTLPTAPTIRSVPTRTQQHARSTALPTHHPNIDISTTTNGPIINAAQTQNNRHSYHPPGAIEVKQQEIVSQHQQQTPQDATCDLHESGDRMSDVSPSMTNSPAETMTTISPNTPLGPVSRDDAFSAVVGAASYQKQLNPDNGSPYDEKHHPNKHHSRASSAHGQGYTPENVTISMCPSNDALTDTSLKKRRKALTKLRQIFSV
ncbi:NUAK SNF1-like kinase 1 [Entomortierella chlamydospora]|uniref:NUAK SNF1-like kinase 1 n=1 Tax=Entomortierella chlamydospora TaxID=101097 RepID=A0A9P6T462_9FUNG|nr:NUAK SNF1-like kinase 1 [Entomortierella chlamydospora]KAG0023848.1 NUAK SNF1-like kinase 1 [Entomortierella chlamydospora]